MKIDRLWSTFNNGRTNHSGRIDRQVGPNQIIHIKLDLLRAIVAGIGRFLLLTVSALALNLLLASAVIDEKLICVRAISDGRLLKKQQGNHPGKEK